MRIDRRLPPSFGLPLPLLLLALFSCVSIRGAIADPPDGDRPPVPESPSSVQSVLLLPQDRQVEQWLQSARQAMESGDAGAAVVLLQRVLQSGSAAFVPVSGTAAIVPAREQAAQLASQLPDESRARFDADWDRSALDGWVAAKQGGAIEAIAEVAARDRMSQPGLEALRYLAAIHRDNGRHGQAAIAWLAVARHPRASKDQRLVAMAAHVESLLAAGQSDAANRAARSILQSPRQTVTIAGRTVVAQDWIAGRLRDAGRSGAAAMPELTRPALQPVWSRDLTATAELQQTVSQIQRYYREQSVISSHAVRPIVTGNVVLTRTMQEVQAFDVKTGEPLWSVPNQEYSWIARRPAFLENSPFRTATAAAWHRRAEADSIFGSLSTNGTLVVAVQEPDRSSFDFPSSNGQGRPGTQPVASTRWNKLCGYEVSSGQLRWQVGGPPTGPADVLGGISFLGVPLFLDDLLFVVARRDDELCLLAMDHGTGHLRWSVKLGGIPPHLSDAVSRRRIACPVVAGDGLLFCTTAMGTLAAVNPITRHVEWACRYAVVQHDLPVRVGVGVPAPAMPDVWWDEWREVACRVVAIPGRDSGIVVLASPDSDQLQAVDGASGAPLWSVPRSGGLHLAGVTADAVVVIEPMAARAHDLQTGRLLWRAETGEVSGRGAIAGTLLFQPRRAGGFAVISLADGTQRPGLIDSDVAHGSLVPCDDGWITQTDVSLQRLPLLDAVRQRLQARWDRDHSDAAGMELARLDLQAGDPLAARRRLAGIQSADAKGLRRDVILAILREQSARTPGARVPGAGDPDHRSILRPELLELCESDEERLIALRALGDAAWAAGDAVAAMTLFLNGLDLVDTIGVRSIGDWSTDAVSVRIVRADRVLLGSIQRILTEARQQSPDASSARLRELEQMLQQRLEEARQGTDPFAVQRLLDRLMPIDWARRSLLANPAQALYARPLQKVEPILLSIAGAADRRMSAEALEQLAAIELQSGWRTSAETLQRRLLSEHPGTPLSSGRTVAATLASDPELAELRGRLLSPIPDPWPTVMPNVERETRRRQDVYQVPVRIHDSPENLLNRLDVTVDRLGRKVRFVSEGHSGSWEIQLPGSPRTLRAQFANLDQAEAHGVGRLLVLRVGSELFGILPFNERGEPGAALTSLQLDLAPRSGELPSEAWWYQEPVPARVGIRPEGSRLVDGLGRPFGGLGPVRPGYLCYRSQSRLVAVETQTGRRLWERLDMPPDCRLLGDDDFVYVWRTDDRRLQVLSAIDGRAVEERSWNVSPDDVLMHSGSRVWSVVRSPGTTVELTDARTGSKLWSAGFAPGAIPFAMDATAVGVLDPAGVLHILAAETGAPLGDGLTVEFPQRVERIVCLHDAQRWYVAISGPVPRLPILQSEQPWGGSRVAFVSGWLYGIERSAGGIVWRRYLDAEPLPRHAPQAVPLFVQMWRHSAEGGMSGNTGQGVLRLLDKRTGREILTHRDPNMQPYFVLLPADDREKLDVFTEQQAFHLNYREQTLHERASGRN